MNRTLLAPISRAAFGPLVVMLLMTTLLPAFEIAAAVSSSERSALLDLYNATNGPEWANDTEWRGAAGTECTWHGVTCDRAETIVTGLNLAANQLRGTIPASIANLGGIFPGLLDLRWNAVHTSNADLVAFLNDKQSGGNWQATQTIAPSGLAVRARSQDRIELTWTPILYTADPGQYDVFFRTTPGGPVISGDSTADKSASSLVIYGLSPRTTYYFAVRTVTQMHANNQNIVVSEETSEVTVSTLECTYTLNPSEVLVGAAGETDLGFEVYANSACAWTAVSDAAWLTIGSGASGEGDASVSYSVAPNIGEYRTATIAVANRFFTVAQASATCPVVQFLPWSLPAAELNTAYTQTLSGSEGTAPYTFMATGLPSWLTLDPSTGVLTGTPTEAGSFSFDVMVKDANNCPGYGSLTVTVRSEACPRIVLGPDGLKGGQMGDFYEVLVTASGGTPPYEFFGTGMPAWLYLDGSGGYLYGSPESAGTFDFTLRARDAGGCEGSRTFKLVVAACGQPATPQFTCFPEGTVTAGSPFTIAWTWEVDPDAGGTYEVSVSANGSCTNAEKLSTHDTEIEIPTVAGQDATYCVTVSAIAGPGCISPPAKTVNVSVQAAPAAFEVVGQAPVVTAFQNEAPPTDTTVVIRNVGSRAGSLTLEGIPGFFSVVPTSLQNVEPGQDATVSIAFEQGLTSEPGIWSDDLVGTWAADEGFATPVTMMVLSGEAGGAEGSKLSYVGTNEVHFRFQGTGSPEPQGVQVVNTGTDPLRVAPRIGPGGGWLSITGDFTTPLQPGETRTYQLRVDRTKRTAADGSPPLVTNLVFLNLDGQSEDAAYGQVFDEESASAGSGSSRPPLAKDEFSMFLGSAVSAEGIGAQFISDGWIRNRGSSEVSVDLYLTPNAENGLSGEGVKKNTLKLGPYTTYRLSDLVKGLFGAEELSGQVEIRSRQLPQLSIRSTADAITTKADGIARYGAEIPIVLSGQGVRKASATAPKGRKSVNAAGDSLAVLTGLRDATSGFRSNLILAETSGKSSTVRIKLYSKDGKLIGQKSVEVLPYSKQQLNSTNEENADLFVPGKSYEGGTAEVVSESGEGSVAVFATVIDNLSGSYATRVGEVFQTSETSTGSVVSRPGWNATGEPAFLPAVVRSEALNSSFYTTRLVVANLSRNPIQMTLKYLPDSGEPITKQVTIPARAEGPRSQGWNDILEDLFGITENSAGMIRFDGNLAPISVASETTTPIDLRDASKGRSISAVNPAAGKPESEALGVYTRTASEVIGTRQSGSSSSIATHPAIEEGYAYRTNLILAEVSGQTAEVRVRLLRSGTSGASLGEKTYSLNPYQRLQRGKVVREILGLASDDPRAEFKDIEIQIEAISGNGSVLAMVTKIDNNPASKRADIFTLGTAVAGSPVSFGD